jgi:hypothetical protein
MAASFTDSNDDKDKDKATRLQKKMNGRQQRVIVGYRLAMVLYSVIGMGMLLGPICKHGLSILPRVGNYAAGPCMAATFCYILQHAAAASNSNRLNSETYKRANLYLSQYGAMYLAAAVLVNGGPLTECGAKMLHSPILLLASLLAVVNGIKGWSYGAKGGWDKPQNKNTSLMADFVDVLVSSWIRILSVVPKSLASLGFLAATLFAATLQIATGVDIVRQLVPEILATLATSSSSSSAAAAMSITSAGGVALKMIQFTRLSMLTCICVTLKDAADRNRLTGTTFIQYNALSTFTFALMSANFLSLKQAPSLAAAAAAVFSLFSAVIGLVSIRVRRSSSSSSSSK